MILQLNLIKEALKHGIMASLKILRNRISSVKSTQKITKAMKMVAAAKLRKAQQNAENARPYSEKLNSIISNLKNSLRVALAT